MVTASTRAKGRQTRFRQPDFISQHGDIVKLVRVVVEMLKEWLWLRCLINGERFGAVTLRRCIPEGGG